LRMEGTGRKGSAKYRDQSTKRGWLLHQSTQMIRQAECQGKFLKTLARCFKLVSLCLCLSANRRRLGRNKVREKAIWPLIKRR
jgi:hypothetical protein